MVVMGTRPMNTNIMRRRVVDRRGSILRVTANLLLFAASSLAALSYLSKTSISKAWPALVNSEHHRGSATVCARTDALRNFVQGSARPRFDFSRMDARQFLHFAN